MSKLNYLNPGIRLTVACLNAAGFETCDSGDGDTHEFDTDREGSYVVIASSPESLVSDANSLLTFLELNHIQVIPLDSNESGVQIQAIYEPLDGTAVIDVSGIHDQLLPDVIVFPGETIVAGHSA